MSKMKGKAEQLKGKTKEEIGDMADDKTMEMKGKAEKAAGRAKESKADAAAQMRKIHDANR
ncbi:CsbD-like protein [Streptomyces sp. 3211.6]|uniref:CsbD family protein n=1 Tax=Streptomyces TaxID=1883 RepID=UPI0009A4C845|nr:MULTISPECIES: CsbD family protein [Streptomyces]RKT02575.1 CsbD-like protein [Streptomyces sp. 3211.6]RPF43902.1 CsbD-like protein [Streptomyces sp. Ag109_G2-6]